MTAGAKRSEAARGNRGGGNRALPDHHSRRADPRLYWCKTSDQIENPTAKATPRSMMPWAATLAGPCARCRRSSEDLRHARRTDRPPRRTRLLASASQSARIVALSTSTSSLDIFRKRKMPSRAMRTDHWAFPWVSFLATPSEFTNRFPEQLLDPGLLWTP